MESDGASVGECQGHRPPVRISIIIPAYNSSRDLSECLGALQSLPFPGSEIIVVDDGSTDDPSSVAGRMGARFFKMDQNSGPAAARNYGGRQAQGEILFFVDADVVVRSEAVSHVVRFFDEHPDIAAVFGSYDTFPRAGGIVSQYRNLLHHFVHQDGNPEASTFWAGCGAIRRSVFEGIGGFDEKRFPRSSIEDIEMGQRLRQAGHRIFLDKTLQATHLKRWTLQSVIRTDIFCRAIPWTRLILENDHIVNDLNLKWGQRLSGGLVMLALFFIPFAAIRLEWLGLSAAALLGTIFLNRDLYAFFLRKRGLFFALACIPLHLLYYLYSMLSYVYVWVGFKLQWNSDVRP